ncbi:hypothetical protein [Actinomadura keratinilytica]|jgi:hypothetical protein|uniref:Secreted protein n=2 Tax=Actinomadura keratinilytica TaxID=547461 RepID=A0ABP7YVP1_9ACTN
MTRVGAVAGICAALAVTAVAGAGPASAASSFDVRSDVSRVTGSLDFPSRTKFTATNVTLYDTSCDNRSARFRFVTNNGAYKWRQIDQCNTSATWSSISGTDGGDIKWVRVETQACNSLGCSTMASQTIDNPRT